MGGLWQGELTEIGNVRLFCPLETRTCAQWLAERSKLYRLTNQIARAIIEQSTDRHFLLPLRHTFGHYSRFPFLTIVFGVLLCGFLSAGRHFRETEVDEDWLPKDSELRDRNEYLQEAFKDDTRANTIVVAAREAANILEADNIRMIYK